MLNNDERLIFVSQAIQKAVRKLMDAGHEVNRENTISTLNNLQEHDEDPYFSDIYRDAALMVRNGKI